MASTGREKNAEHVYTMKTVGRRLLVRAWADDDERGVTVNAKSRVDLEQHQCFQFIRKVEECQFFPSGVDNLRRSLSDPYLTAHCRLEFVTAALWRFTGFEDETGLELLDFIVPRGHPLRYEVLLSFEPSVLVLEDTRMVCKPDRRRKQQELYMQDDPDPIALWNSSLATGPATDEAALISADSNRLTVIRKGFPLANGAKG